MSHHLVNEQKQKKAQPLDEKQSGLDFNMVLASSIHDMKNSLSMLLNQLEQLGTTLKNTPEGIEIRYQAERLRLNLAQLLTLYRMDKKQYCVNIGEHSVYEMFEELVLHHQPVLNHKNIQLEIDCDDTLMWFFDRELVDGLLANLVNNAYRYASKCVRLVARIENKWLKLSVIDDGPGYPATMLDAYKPEQSQISFCGGSTGLGLYFAHNIAQLHTNKLKMGYIILSNNGINNGASFNLYLP